MTQELSLDRIRAQASANAPLIRRTPLFDWRSRRLEDRIGAATRVALKLELFQHTGTFKARGAVTSVAALSPEARARGITAVSAGNHAVAAAYAAHVLGASARVVMIRTADPVRVEAARAWGAEVLLARDGPSAFALAEEIRGNEGRAFIHPFEGRDVALGTATLGLELDEQAGALDAVIIAVGGGGLCGGMAAALRQLQPSLQIYGVEPEGADTMYRSFEAGSPQARDDIRTIADSLAPPFALPYSFGLCRAYVDRLVRIDDAAMLDAMRLLHDEFRLTVEPAGAAATAALLGPLRDELEGLRVGVILCGSNISVARFAALVGEGWACGAQHA